MKKRLFRLGALCCAAAMTITTGAQALSVEEAYDILQRSYVDKLPRAAQDAKSLDELFSYTDDYTYYMTAEEYQAFLQGVEGDVSFAGIGAEITYVPEGIRIVSVLKGGGAEKAGLAAGDIIIAIESESCAPGGAEHRAKLLGEAGTSVTVTVRHADGTQADYTVTRALVTQTNTTVSVTGGVGYIDCDSFGTQTGTYFQEGVRGNDSAVHAWIVDLRGNGGGLTSAAVSALGAFSGEGDLTYFVDQDGESTAQSYSGKDLTDKPAIVLMDSGSASASEIFAGGVLGTGSGIVIGTRSYGKGVAQVLYDESTCPYLHGDAVKVTAYRFYCAGGNTTDRIGVVPTLYIPQDQAVAAARLLSGEKTKDSAYLRLVLNGCDFYIDIPAGKESSSAALEAILAALTPDAVLYWGENGGERKLTLAQAREKCGFAASSALDFSDISASEAMTARVDMVAIDIDDDWDEILRVIDESTYSRLPVYSDSVDNIIGFLYLNRFFKAMMDGRPEDLRAQLIPPCFVYKTTRLPDVLAKLRREQKHLAVVTDEYGGTLGVITMEDVLEELVGDIWDETDEVEREVVARSDGGYELDGDMTISDFLELLGWNEDALDDADSATVGGWTLERFGTFPKPGDSFRYENLTVTVLAMDGRRVERVLVQPDPASDKDE